MNISKQVSLLNYVLHMLVWDKCFEIIEVLFIRNIFFSHTVKCANEKTKWDTGFWLSHANQWCVSILLANASGWIVLFLLLKMINVPETHS